VNTGAGCQAVLQLSTIDILVYCTRFACRTILIHLGLPQLNSVSGGLQAYIAHEYILLSKREFANFVNCSEWVVR
jgi:hypothetical protein